MTLSIKEPGQKLRRAPKAPCRRPCLSKARRRLEKKKTHWDLVEERRRIAFENLAREMLRYLDNSDDVKVGITEWQERSEVPVLIGISIQQVAQQGRSENGQEIFEVFWQEGELCVASWARWDAQWKSLMELERRCQDMSREIQMLSKRQDIFQNAIEGKLRVQSIASERLLDQIIEEIKEMEQKRTEEALQLVEKEHDLWMYHNEKEEAKRLQGMRKPRKDEEMAWAPPKIKSAGKRRQ